MTVADLNPEDAKKDETLAAIYFYLTPECNLACRHCWISPVFKKVDIAEKYLPLNIFNSIIEQAIPLGLLDIKLTGGEPLLHPDILQILSIAQEKGLGINVETNGTLISEEFVESFSQCKNRFISVSLDGVNAATHEWVRGVPGSFDRTIKGIRRLCDTGLKPQIIMSLFKRNIDQIEPLIELAIDLGADSVKFNIIQPIARGVTVHEHGETLSVAEIIQTSELIHSTFVKDYSIRLFFSIPPVFKLLSLLFGDNGCGCGTCNLRHIIGVLADGSYALCGIGETIPELVFGHALKDPLEMIWKKNPVLREIREGLPGKLTGICAECVMKSICKGSCLAQNFFRTYQLWAPYWFCEMAHEQGLFPEKRILIKNSQIRV